MTVCHAHDSHDVANDPVINLQLHDWLQLCIYSIGDFVVLDEKMDFHLVVGLQDHRPTVRHCNRVCIKIKFAIQSIHLPHASGQHVTLFFLTRQSQAVHGTIQYVSAE